MRSAIMGDYSININDFKFDDNIKRKEGMTDKDREQILEELKKLYQDNCEFIEKKIKTDKEFSNSLNFEKAKAVNCKLLKYLEDFDSCKHCIYKKEYWCNLMAQALYSTRHNVLDDDNFPIDEDDL